jgi:hypothetical protein
MITVEMLTNDTVLGSLTDEQKQAIATLSKNDEEVVIGGRFREVYNQLDETIARETGIARNGDEKTYLYLERAARELAAKANSVEGLNNKVSELTRERDRLKKVIEDGSQDPALKKQLDQAQADLENVRKEYDTLKQSTDQMRQQHAAEMLGLQVDNELRGAMGGLRFKAEFPQAVTDTILKQAIEKVKGMNPEFIDNGQGGKKLIFRNADGSEMRNAENRLEPYTAAELLAKELKAMGVLDEGRQQQGGGTKPVQQSSGGASTVYDIGMARTQAEAYEVIATQLMRQGMTNGSKEFDKAIKEAMSADNVRALPIQ